MEIRTVGVVGCGLMGSGIAHTAAMSGYDVIVREVSEELVAKGRENVQHSIQRWSVRKGQITEAEGQQLLTRIRFTTQLQDLRDCHLIIEAITENMDLKKQLFRELDKICPPDTIFASNTSSLCITEMAVVTQRSARFLGLHFFNPVPIMKLVEVVRTELTHPDIVQQCTAFVESLGKTPIQAPDRPGFIVNRLLVPYLLDAIRCLEEGLATPEDIDQGMVLGCGHPMGPFTLLDFVGLDTTYYIALAMYEEFRDKRFAPPPLLKRMVLAGHLGRKTGRGFYDYSKKGGTASRGSGS